MGLLSRYFGKKYASLYAPVAGQTIPIQQVSDPAFSGEILGKGIAILPIAGKVFAPCDATVETMFETGHAVTLAAEFGAEVLIHVGLDTVKLKGRHFTAHVSSGDRVRKGQLLMEFDRDAIIAAGYDVVTPVVVCNSSDYPTFQTYPGISVTGSDVIIRCAKI